MPQTNMPADWQPPVDAWQSAFPAGLHEAVFGYFGCQFRGDRVPAAFLRNFHAATEGPLKPAFVTRARHTDASGYRNEVFVAYWPSRTAFDAWWCKAGFGGWFVEDVRLSDKFGLWREVYAVPIQRFETLFSSQDPTGVARLGSSLAGPVREHNYWGGMRDRIPSSDTDDFAPGDPEVHKSGKSGETRGQRISVQHSENICLIRSGQNWGNCDDDELAVYSDVVVPHLTAGMAFLRDNPQETGCLSCRFMDELTLEGQEASQTFGLAAFTSMEHLEAWAKTHPTHLRIFDSFLSMVQKRAGPPKLKLWHEVLVARGKDSACDYVNCHPRTGFLPFFNPRAHSSE